MLFRSLANAIDKILGRHKSKYIEDYENLADAINHGYYNKNNEKDKSDYEIGM